MTDDALRPLSVGIVGGGVGGLTLALCCISAGLTDIAVYETAPEGATSEPVDAIDLSPNATRVLHAIGLKRRIEAIGSRPRLERFRSGRTGFLIGQRPLGDFSATRYGAPHYRVLGDQLRSMLLDEARSRGVKVRCGQTCSAVSQTTGAATAEFANRAAHHDVIVGCDGESSCVREHLGGSPERHHAGRIWCGSIDAQTFRNLDMPPEPTSWLGPARFLLTGSAGHGSFSFTAITPDSDEGPAGWSKSVDIESLVTQFASWHPSIGRLVGAVEVCRTRALFDWEPLASWSDRRVCLLGDACHPTLPFLGQGAALAIEDAWVLAHMLERWEDEPVAGIAEYERYRRPRALRVQRAARAQGSALQLDRLADIVLRNVKLALTTRFLPEVALSQRDWLYGYDCIRGFA